METPLALFQPRSGGRFDVALVANQIRITHNFGLINDASRPVTQAEFDTWKINFNELMRTHWEGKYEFQRAGQVVRPRFFQTFEDDQPSMATAHFVIKLRDGQGGNELVSSKPAQIFEALRDQGVYFPMASTMAKGSVQATNSRGLIHRSLPSFFPAYVDTFNGTLTVQTRAHVASLARQIAALDASIKLSVTGYGNAGARGRNAVVAVLRENGVRNAQSRVSKKFLKPSTWGTSSQSKVSGRTDYVKITIGGEIGLELLTEPIYTYPAAAVHEFGHMLGLKDEYACLSDQGANRLVELDFIEPGERAGYQDMHFNGARTETDEVAAQQAEFIKYCHDAGVEPTTFGQYTTSIMSAGSEFHPCHFVTIWAALVHITGQNDWSIVKST